MSLKPEGAKVAMLGEPERKKHALALLKGADIRKYTGGICYDAVAYVRFLLGKGITPSEIASINGNAWRDKLKFLSGKRWDGKSAIPAGSAVGFYRLIDHEVFHGAVSIGGSSIRAVNGHVLGAGWTDVADLKKVLGKPDTDGNFDYDRTKIQVWISKI